MARFDIDDKAIRKLAALIEDTGLTEIEYREGDRLLRVAKGVPPQAGIVPAAPAAAPPAPGDGAAGGPEAAPVGALLSPMVGTVYLQSDPTAPQFVRVGDQVEQGETVAIIEAMKVMNQIPSPVAGVVKRIIVANGSPVEFGEPLMVIE